MSPWPDNPMGAGADVLKYRFQWNFPIFFSPSNPDKVYSIVENANGGMFVSSDAGETWTLTSNDNNIRQRAWYYTKVFVDPKNENLVYAPNVGFMRSRDGGKTFQSVRTPHGDHHDLWIDPENGE